MMFFAVFLGERGASAVTFFVPLDNKSIISSAVFLCLFVVCLVCLSLFVNVCCL